METQRESASSQCMSQDYDVLNLWDFLSESARAGSCFCCGSRTELLLDEHGHSAVLCPVCSARISDWDEVSAGRSFAVLQAA